MDKFIRILSVFLASTLGLLAIFGLIFRATFYWNLPVNDADSIGDELDLLIYFSIFVLTGLSMLLGILMLMVPAWRNIRFAIILLIVSLIVPPFYFMFHSIITQLN